MTERELAQILSARTLELCRIPSVIGNEGEIADHVEKWGRAHFPAERVYRLSQTVVFGTPRIDSRPTVGLFGHLDTVPAHPNDVEPHIDADNVIGLGASDMKGALAVMQLLAEQHDQAKLPFNLVYVFYEREEGPYLENGSVIEKENTSIPQAVGPVLDQLSSLVSSIPKDRISDLLDETFTAFNGTGPDFQSLVDSAGGKPSV